jgi:hypothetical protein
MFLGTGAVALLCATVLHIASGGRTFAEGAADFRIADFIGGALGLYLISWAVAGVAYLFSGMRISRTGLAYTAAVASFLVSGLVYLGMMADG